MIVSIGDRKSYQRKLPILLPCWAATTFYNHQSMQAQPHLSEYEQQTK